MPKPTNTNPRSRAHAEDVLSRDYEPMKCVVIKAARTYLRKLGLRFDDLDLEAFYNEAWDALHSKLAKGDDVHSPEGFLIKVARRRAIDEARRMTGIRCDDMTVVADLGEEHDLAAKVEEKTCMRHYIEGMREVLTEQEYRAVTLCVIGGLTRPEAAGRLGESPDRMERIMDAAQCKLRSVTAAISNGEWCDAHESLMRAYARRVLAEHGDRYKLAKTHLADCPACRRFVNELRGNTA
jgi:DNA-directed RNA polymerase specialized sigma24 family protein